MIYFCSLDQNKSKIACKVSKQLKMAEIFKMAAKAKFAITNSYMQQINWNLAN
jgi:hypothetical protein